MKDVNLKEITWNSDKKSTFYELLENMALSQSINETYVSLNVIYPN